MMSLAKLKQEAAVLSSAERTELMAFLGSTELAEQDEFRAELTCKIDDTSPTNWMDLDDLKKRWLN